MEQTYGTDGVITESERIGITQLYLSEKRIYSLKGIELFTYLEYLYCGNNKLTSLDVSKNTRLEHLHCGSNQLTSLDVSKNTRLERLQCYNNKLTSLIVGGDIDWLYELDCGNNKLTSLDVSKNAHLDGLYCGNNELTSLDVSKNLSLSTLHCGNNQLTSLDVSKNTRLKELHCYNNQIKGEAMDALVGGLPKRNGDGRIYVIDMSNSPLEISCTSSHVDIAKRKGWSVLTSKGEDYASIFIFINSENFPDENFRTYLMDQTYGKDGVIINYSEFEEITSLSLSSKNISSLKGIEFFTALKSLDCNNNNLTSLDVSKNTALNFLYCYTNKLTHLEMSEYNIALTTLDCHDNQLTNLDVSKNPDLKEMQCYSNKLTSLDVSKNTALTNLDCNSNQLTRLDVSKNTYLTELHCYNNQIKGEAMDALVDGLRYGNKCIYVIDLSNSSEGNVCTTTQVDIAKEKGWSVLTSDGKDYEGSTPTGIIINSENFPDENFRAYLMKQTYGKDGVLTESELKEITSLSLSSKKIISLKGIEFFTALTSLDCNNNQLTSLDVSKNTALKGLNCGINQLTSLEVSENTALEYLHCYNNQLTSLDVSKNTALRTLDCHSNQLTSLIMTENTYLTGLACYDNQIKGEAMDALVGELPKRNGDGRIYVIDLSNSSEGNVCTTTQVDIAKGKGWKVLTSQGKDYEGSDPTAIKIISLDKENSTPVYDLKGRKLKEPSKGINIIGGRKVLGH